MQILYETVCFIIKLLLGAGLDPYSKSNSGESPLLFPAASADKSSDHERIVQFLLEIVTLILMLRASTGVLHFRGPRTSTTRRS